MNQLTLEIIKLSDNQDSFGNQLLYDMCTDNEDHPWGDAARLADKIWLIGRSYAASPERRYRGKKEVKAPKQENPGDGTGLYFAEVAVSLCDDSRYSRLVKMLKLLERPYCFDSGAEDIDQLQIGIACVSLFNAMIKAASEKFDERHNPGIIGRVIYKNQISFCSKFLHFHAPQAIFIIDHFTLAGGTYLCSPQCRTNAVLGPDSLPIDKDTRAQIARMAKNVVLDEKERLPDEIKYYKKHCLHAYTMGCFLQTVLSADPLSSYPRMIDTIFQNVKLT